MKEKYKQLEKELNENSWLNRDGSNKLVIHFQTEDVNKPIVITDNAIIRRLEVELKTICRKEYVLND